FSPLPALVRHLPPSFQKDRLLKASGLPLEKRYATIPTVFDRATHARLFSPALFAACTHHIADHAAERFHDCNAASYLERIMHVDLTLWLPDDLLTKVDRATMAFSLEARVPYLDHRFVEFVARLSPALKQHGGTTKYILKKLAARYLPREIIERPKQGFVMPLSEWLAGGLKPAMEHAISPAGLGRRGLFRNGALQRLHAEHLRGRRNHAGRLWALTVLEKWFEHYDPGFRL
ncbi:MAG TPA: asparagine synthase C-terminal domain-containing protein, partial [Usitatibacteraceae bacterium]|nr:asparagine synthase C-terminal domain-containing protein [Usitatibacteraceae bacterium]